MPGVHAGRPGAGGGVKKVGLVLLQLSPQPRSLIEKAAYPWEVQRRSPSFPPEVPKPIFEPPQPWKTMTREYAPSGPLAGAGGKATLTSIGTPSKAGTVVALPPHSRTPSAATVQGTAPPKTLGIAACAAGAKRRPPQYRSAPLPCASAERG